MVKINKKECFENMDDIKTYRYEIKIPLQQEQFFEFHGALRQLGLFPKKVFPRRVIHSVYMDTAKFDDYISNVSGASKRKKVRFRWYDEEVKNLVLELKMKSNKVSQKAVIALENKNQEYPTSLQAVKNILEENRAIACLEYAKGLFPVLEVEYTRDYYEIAPQIRMTIDQNLKYKKLYPLESRQYKKSPVAVVVEFKYPVGKENEVKKILKGVPFRVFRHSKYVIGVDTVCA